MMTIAKIGCWMWKFYTETLKISLDQDNKLLKETNKILSFKTRISEITIKKN